MEELMDKYGIDMIMLTIKIDQLSVSEIEDLEYLEERILTHLEVLDDE
jgi:hypothetical protein